jgi:peptide/nickel transport system permease protein
VSEQVPPDEGPSHLALRLSRRKAMGTGIAIVRHSLRAARRAAAPYATMMDIAATRLGRDRLARTGTLLVLLLAAVAIAANLLASDLPIACRWKGTVYVLPCLVRPAALSEIDCLRIERDRSPGDWSIEPLVPFGPTGRNDAAALAPPMTARHPLGTDARGRDVFARLVYGARTALKLGMFGSAVMVALGTALGAAGGFLGGIVDSLVSRAVESLTAIPTLLMVLVVGGLVPHSTTATLVWTIALTRWTELARLVRAEVLVTLGTDYITAARALGVSPWRILLRHVAPNALGPAIVAATFGVAAIVLTEASVDFLGVGPPDATASWGETLGEARSHPTAWWLIAYPGAALLTTLMALNLIGEAARDALDPKLRGVSEAATEGMRG